MTEINKTQTSDETQVDGPFTASPSVGEQISAKATQWGEGVTELGRMAANQIDHPRDAAADCLQVAACAVYDTAPKLPGGKTAAKLATSAADGLGATADYLREHDVNGMIADVKHRLRSNPVPMLIAAVAVGIFLGRAMGRTRD